MQSERFVFICPSLGLAGLPLARKHVPLYPGLGPRGRDPATLKHRKTVMEQLNRVELRGIVGSVRIQTYDESKMARIGLATNSAYKDREGAAVIDTSWHNVIAWEGRNIQGLDKIGKGTKLHVLGRIRYQNYTGVDGIDRTGTDILASQIKIIDDPSQMSYEM
jgi:single-strand DNA-binding protein